MAAWHGRVLVATALLGGAFVAACLALGLFGTAKPASADNACTINWVGPSTGGLWSTVTNWSPGRIPGASDIVCIGEAVGADQGMTGTVTFDGSSGTSTTLVEELRGTAPLSITGGELGLTDTAATGNTVSGLSLSGGQLGDESNDQGSLSVTGGFSWTGGSFHAPPAQSPQPVLTDTDLSAGSASIVDPFYVDNWNLNFDGPLVMSGSFYFENGGGITEAGAATFRNGSIANAVNAGPFTLTATGTLTETTGGVSAEIEVSVALSSGTVTVPAGDTLDLGTAGTVSGSIGDFTVGSGASLGLNEVNIATASTNSGAGTVDLSGPITVSPALDVAKVTEQSGTTTVSTAMDLSGALTVAGGEVDLAAAGNAVGGFLMSGGQLGDTSNDQGSLTDTGRFSWTGGSFHAPPAQSPQPVLTDTDLSAGSASIVDPFYVDNWNLHFDGPLAMSGSFYFENGGGITETGAATFGNGSIANALNAGPFTLTATGTLTTSGPAISASVDVPVANAGTISSGGGDLTLGSLTGTGTLNVGEGTVAISSSYVPASGSTLAVTLGGTAAGTTYGQLQVTGTMTLGGTLAITTAGGFTPTVGQVFTVTTTTGGTPTGTFASITQSGTPAGLTYDENATAAGVTLTAVNQVGAPAMVSVVAGNNQQAIVGDAYTTGLEVLVVDADSNPVPNASVTFTAPDSGASGAFAATGCTSRPSATECVVTTNAFGEATASTFAANGSPGHFAVAGAVIGATPATFDLTNDIGSAHTLDIVVGNAQHATVGDAYTTDLEVKAVDAFGNPVAGVTVTFSAPASGPSGTFASAGCTSRPTSEECVVITNGLGEATAAAFTANTTSGAFHVTADASAVSPATLDLTNEPGPPETLKVVAGNAQQIPVAAPFPVDLEVTVVDAFGNPVPGVTVTFTAPASGPSGTFAPCGVGNPNADVCVVTSNGSGDAIASSFTANSTVGAFHVSASSGTLTPAGFLLTNQPPAQKSVIGYWLVAKDGGVFSFNAPFYGSTGDIRLNAPIIGMASDPATGGYWLVASDGGVFSFHAPFFGSTGGIRLNQPVVGMVATPDGRGYWLVAKDGGVFSFGDAHFYGSTGDIHLTQPVVGMAVASGGDGYWLVASDGGVFTFGPGATFHGSTSDVRLAEPVVGMATDAATGGYRLVAADGGVFTFDAPFYGSTGSLGLVQSVVGLAADPATGGYWVVADNGSVYNFNAPLLGSTAGVTLNQPVIGMAVDLPPS
jgi:hypothetical protein